MIMRNNTFNQRVRLEPKCLVELPLSERNTNDPVRTYNVPAGQFICIGFTLDSVPGGDGAIADCTAVSVQTHGYIDIAYNDPFVPNGPVLLHMLQQPPTDQKQVNNPAQVLGNNVEIGRMVAPLARMPSDAPNVHRMRIRLNGDPVIVVA